QGFAEKIKLKQNQSKSFALLFALPKSAPDGTYALVATVDTGSMRDLDASNNTAASSSTVRIAPSHVDLTGGGVTAPAAAVPGKAAVVPLSIANAGNTAVKSTGAVEFMASTDGTMASAVALATVSNLKLNVQPGATQAFSTKPIIPASLPPGSYYLLALL